MIDLHTHSTASDGSCSPERLVALSLAAGLSALALTDHDTLDGVGRASRSAEGTGLRLLPGVEIEIACDSGEFHLLGLGLSGDTVRIGRALETMRSDRRERNRRMVEKFTRAGIPVTMEELDEMAGGGVVSRAHFARLLIRKKVVGSVDAAFSRYIGKGKDFYEPRPYLALEEATELIRSAGGIAVVAHPLSLGLRGSALRRAIAGYREQGVGGIEAWHPTHAVKDCRMLERMAGGLGMAVTGGSDFHGEHLPQRKLGFTAGGCEVPDSFLDSVPLQRLQA